MGCCSSKKKAEPAVASKTVNVNKTGNTKTSGGVVNKGFSHTSSVMESPTITITTADEVAAQLKQAREAEAKQKQAVAGIGALSGNQDEGGETKPEKPTTLPLTPTTPTVPTEATTPERGPKPVTPLVQGGKNLDELDGLAMAAALSEAVRRGSDVGKMETIGEEGEEEEEEEEEKEEREEKEEEEEKQADKPKDQGAEIVSPAPSSTRKTQLGPTLSGPTSRKFSQIAPGAVDDPNAVKLGSKFVMIPTQGQDVIVEEE